MKTNKISWFRGWFIFFSPLLYVSFGLFNIILMVNSENFYKITTIVSLNDTRSDSAGDVCSFSSIINHKVVKLETLKDEVMENYVGDRWAYAHPYETNYGLELTPKQRMDSSKIKVWYHPKSYIAYVISEPKYEKEFPADEIIWTNLKWFIGFSILPFYFFVRWMIEWVIVKLIRRKIKNTDENTI
jgi:hypothetical protein